MDEGGNACKCSFRDKRALDGLIENLTDAWFNDQFKDWKKKYRIFFAFLGAFSLFSFLTPNIVERIFEDLPTISSDPAFSNYSLFGILFGSIMSVFFAMLVSWRNEKSGPVRMYLAGLTLPAFAWYIIEKAVHS